MRTIEPGESLVYQYRADYAGAFMYHCGTAPELHHIGNGMYGAIIIDPPNLPAVDHEFVVVQSELYLGEQGQPGDLDKITNADWDAVVFNGYYNQYKFSPIRVEPDERIRVWVIDDGPSEHSAFHIVGTIFDTVWKEGSYLLQPDATNGGSQVLDLQPAQGGFVEFSFAEEGFYPMVTHKFANGWQAKAAALWKRPEQDMTFSGLSRIGGTLYQNTQSYRLDNRQDSYDVSLNGPFTLLGQSHELMFGASHREYDNRNWGGWAGYSWTTSGPVVDPYNWNASRVPRPGIDMAQWGIDNTTRQQALYAATRLSLTTSLKLILGSRVNWYESTNHRASARYAVDGEVTPYAGLVYALDDKHSLYASWTEIFEPQGSNDLAARNSSALEICLFLL